MALTVSADIGLCGNYELDESKARGLKLFIGRLTGIYGGALTTVTLSNIGLPLLVCIPPASNYAFQYNPGTQMFAILDGPSATSNCFGTVTTTFDLASFACYWNGTTSAGLPFFAFGF
jgi:hypothetical protein